MWSPFTPSRQAPTLRSPQRSRQHKSASVLLWTDASTVPSRADMTALNLSTTCMRVIHEHGAPAIRSRQGFQEYVAADFFAIQLKNQQHPSLLVLRTRRPDSSDPAKRPFRRAFLLLHEVQGSPTLSGNSFQHLHQALFPGNKCRLGHESVRILNVVLEQEPRVLDRQRHCVPVTMAGHGEARGHRVLRRRHGHEQGILRNYTV